MLGKLAFRNMKRSARDYLVYVLTMTLVTALVYAFSSLIFRKDFIKIDVWNDMMGTMVIVASVFVVLIAAWLIGYMVRFILEKRSSEFGIYLLLGMKKKKIAGLYMRETLLLGSGAFLLGLVLGILLRRFSRRFFWECFRKHIICGDASSLYAFDDLPLLLWLLSSGAASLQEKIQEDEYP